MKKTVFTRLAAATLILAAVACQKENFEGGNAPQTQENLVPMTITASLEADTKAALQEGGKVFWEKDDMITVLSVDAEAAVTSYEFTTVGEGEKADFSGLVGEETINLSEGMYAVYPSTVGDVNPYIYGDDGYSGYKHTVSSGNIKMFMPSTQFASSDASNLYSLCAGVVTINESNANLYMKNVGGLIALTLPSQNITSVTLYGNSGEHLAGVVTASFDEDGIPVVSEVSGSNMIRVIPSVKNTTFTAGTYYINVPPMTFTGGMTLVFTNSDNQYATVRSSDSFVVERSKVSEFPNLPTLSFSGKYIDLTWSDDYTVTKGVSATKLYCDVNGNNTYDSETDAIKLCENGLNILTDGVNDFSVYGNPIGANTGYSGGLILTLKGDYIAFPVFDGLSLCKVSVRAGTYKYETAAGQCITTTPTSEGVYEILPNCTPWTGNIQGGMDYVWSFNGDAYKDSDYPLALTVTETPNSTQKCRLQAIRLYYAESPEDGGPSVNPLITNIENVEPTVDYPNNKITMRAVFSAVDYSSLSQFTCGFDYKLSADSEWSTLTCETPALEFSADLSPASRTTVAYRPWVSFVKKDGQVKKVYAEQKPVDMSRIVLEMVFDDSYWERTPDGKNLNFLVREWGWKTNQNTFSVWSTNGGETKDYPFNYNGVDYPFNFWALGGLEIYDADGKLTEQKYGTITPTLHVYGDAMATRGLCLSFSNTGYHAWMKLPGVNEFKLTNISGTTYNQFAIDVNDSVDTTSENTNVLGTPNGNKVGSKTKSGLDMDIKLAETQAGVRYYFCVNAAKPTIRNMTLTYEYAGE